MGCALCKRLRAEQYEEKAGECLPCMLINVGLALVILALLWWLGLPLWACGLLFVAMCARIYHVGYLLPETPSWLPHIDFLLEPFGLKADESEALEKFAPVVVEICNEVYDDEAKQSECNADMTDIITLRYRGQLTEMQFYAALGQVLDMEPEELRERVSEEIDVQSASSRG